MVSGSSLEHVVPPSAHPPQGMTLSAVLAGSIAGSAALAYQGGSFGDKRTFNIGAILVQHPRGNLLFDTGFGRNIDQHIGLLPWYVRLLLNYEKEIPVVEQLRASGIKPSGLLAVILTHAHWDHVSGLEDLGDVSVWVDQEELDFIRSGNVATLLARQIGTRNYVVFSFSSGPYLGFSRSHDVFGDGSVVLVPAPGHTPGSIIAFITLPDQKRFALIGDVAWESEGVSRNVQKPWLVRKFVDDDSDELIPVIEKLHQLTLQIPGLTIVPAHDRRVWNSLPKLAPR